MPIVGGARGRGTAGALFALFAAALLEVLAGSVLDRMMWNVSMGLSSNKD